MKRTALLALIIWCAGPCFAISDQQQIQHALKQQFIGKTLILRHDLTKDSQQYDETGNVLTRADEGSWTVYGGMTIKKVTLRSDRLDIEGRRVLLTFKQHPDAITSLPGDGTVKVKILLKKPCGSQEDAVALLHRVFAISNRELYESVPVVWKAYVKRLLVQKEFPQGTTQENSQKIPIEPAPGASVDLGGLFPENQPGDVGAGDGEPKFSNLMKLGQPGLILPRAAFTPEPSYTDLARKHRLVGTVAVDSVIDENGEIAFLQIREPVGMGLDEAAIAALRTWKFEPGRIGGKKVKVLMMLEVQFNLY